MQWNYYHCTMVSSSPTKVRAKYTTNIPTKVNTHTTYLLETVNQEQLSRNENTSQQRVPQTCICMYLVHHILLRTRTKVSQQPTIQKIQYNLHIQCQGSDDVHAELAFQCTYGEDIITKYYIIVRGARHCSDAVDEEESLLLLTHKTLDTVVISKTTSMSGSWYHAVPQGVGS